MNILFLATDPLANSDALIGGGILALILGMMAFVFVVGIIWYVYMSFAYMSIAKKAKQSSPGLAWIPFVGPNIIAFNAANTHWWPWLLIIGFFIPYINAIAWVAFLVYTVIWRWKLFEAVSKPGWWSVLCLIPLVDLIMTGIVAWSKD